MSSCRNYNLNSNDWCELWMFVFISCTIEWNISISFQHKTIFYMEIQNGDFVRWNHWRLLMLYFPTCRNANNFREWEPVTVLITAIRLSREENEANILNIGFSLTKGLLTKHQAACMLAGESHPCPNPTISSARLGFWKALAHSSRWGRRLVKSRMQIYTHGSWAN
jgi:hypothetical protein